MKSQNYMDRAMRARDPRYVRILGRLGYATADMVAAEDRSLPEDDIAALREQYREAVGKKPFNGWDADTLREKIAAKQNAG